MTALVSSYFTAHPTARDGVLKAYYAWHAPHFRCDPQAHNFTSSLRESRCQWCDRSREDVRWDDLPHGCANRPRLPDIKETLRAEAEKAFALLTRAEREVPKLIERLGMSGETLARIHQTNGYDPETVAGIVDVPPLMLADYHAAMELERERSRGAQVREVVTAKTL